MARFFLFLFSRIVRYQLFVHGNCTLITSNCKQLTVLLHQLYTENNQLYAHCTTQKIKFQYWNLYLRREHISRTYLFPGRDEMSKSD